MAKLIMRFASMYSNLLETNPYITKYSTGTFFSISADLIV